jgi:hypothetical protein
MLRHEVSGQVRLPVFDRRVDRVMILGEKVLLGGLRHKRGKVAWAEEQGPDQPVEDGIPRRHGEMPVEPMFDGLKSVDPARPIGNAFHRGAHQLQV